MFVTRKFFQSRLASIEQYHRAEMQRQDERYWLLRGDLDALQTYLKLKRVALPSRVEFRPTD